MYIFIYINSLDIEKLTGDRILVHASLTITRAHSIAQVVVGHGGHPRLRKLVSFRGGKEGKEAQGHEDKGRGCGHSS